MLFLSYYQVLSSTTPSLSYLNTNVFKTLIFTFIFLIKNKPFFFKLPKKLCTFHLSMSMINLISTAVLVYAKTFENQRRVSSLFSFAQCKGKVKVKHLVVDLT